MSIQTNSAKPENNRKREVSFWTYFLIAAGIFMAGGIVLHAIWPSVQSYFQPKVAQVCLYNDKTGKTECCGVDKGGRVSVWNTSEGGAPVTKRRLFCNG